MSKEAEMLALNAAIEAARAGEMGRGFAVVADSMKSLSRNSQESTHEIQHILSVSEAQINQIVESSLKQNEVFKSSIELLLESFIEIKRLIKDISVHSSNISQETHATNEGVEVTEKTVKTIVEAQIKQLSDLVSLISGAKIVDVSPKEVSRSMDSYDEIIDVRRPEEFNDELGHLDKAILSTLQTDFQQYVKQLNPKKTYLFVCRSGGRSTKAAQMAINNGIKKVFNLDGGMLAWNGK